MQKTLSIIKPDATMRNITGKINSIIENAGLKIVAQKMIKLSTKEAGEFYAEHEGKPFFQGILENMTTGPVIVQVLQADDAIALYRKTMGATNPEAADEGTIRKSCALSMSQNSVHGSDSTVSAEREINFFFNKSEIVG